LLVGGRDEDGTGRGLLAFLALEALYSFLVLVAALDDAFELLRVLRDELRYWLRTL
jgi:hypothetical protein